MALRMIEIYHKSGKADEIDVLVKDLPILETWHDHLTDNNESVTKVLLKSENTESLLNTLDNFFSTGPDMRIVILPVEATLPRPDEPEEGGPKATDSGKSPQRISIEELYQKMYSVSGVSNKYIIMATLASIVAAIGLLKNDVAVIIGSMVIAPLLAPNMALSLATTLADLQLAKKAIKTNVAGFTIVFVISLVFGFFMMVDPDIPQIASRSDVSHFYIFLAFAAGVAGAYSITAGVAEALVGVMVAVALLPPLVASGLLFGGHYIYEGIGALLLCLVNVVCVNLAGVVTFLAEGIQPKTWWKAARARKAARAAIAVWITMLVLLAVAIFFAQKLQ
ncbi:MAG: hypothetical protein AMK71_05125 [Nitrospira bacterium SG8_35_4]|nr:MAG: hypothetical protein AMK71_05125 [Nitrospira bacterium SG8_35_4]